MTTEATTSGTTTETTATAEESNSSNVASDSWDDAPQSADEASEEGEGGKEAAPEKAQPKKERKWRKVVVDGKEEMVDEDLVFRDYQKYRSADREKRELAEQRKRLDAFFQTFQSDPIKVLQNSKIPINRRQLAEQWLKEEISRELQDPKDVALAERDKKLADYEAKEKAEKDRIAQEERTRRANARREELGKTFSEAMSKSPLAKSPAHSAEVLRDMAMYMRVARQNGEEVTADELADHVERQRLGQYHAAASEMEGDDLINFLGEAIVNKIRKADLNRIRKGREPEQVNEPQQDSWVSSRKEKDDRTFIDPVTAREQVKKHLGLS